MFRPTTTSPFRAVAALNKFKIHQPAPLDKRESQRLLDLLTTSFRKQLDAEHPMPSSNPPSTANPLLPLPQKKPRRHSMSDWGRNATERHMTSVLTNPLFDVPPNKSDTAVEKDPMDVFDRAVAAGMMTTQYATGILKAKKQFLRGSEVRRSGAGLRVLKWLVNSGQIGDDPFLRDHQFTKILTEFLVAEGLQEATWFWIHRSLRRASALPCITQQNPGPLDLRDIDAMTKPLIYLVDAEKIYGSIPDAVYRALPRAVEILSFADPRPSYLMLRPTIKFVVNTAVQAWESQSHQPASESAFEDLLSVMARLSTERRNKLLIAQLNLVHPTKPNADLALNCLRDAELYFDIRHAHGLDTGHRRWAEEQLVWIGLWCSELLLIQGNTESANWVLSFLRKNYHHRLGIDRSSTSEASEELSDESFLRGFSVA